VVPEVAFLQDKPVGPETEQRHPGQILAAAIRQSGLRTPGHGSLITVDDRRAKPALRRFLLREHAGQIARLRIAERMLLPECAFGIKRADSGYVMPGPAAFPYLCPPLSCLSRIHTPTLDKGTDKRPNQQGDEQPGRQTAHPAQDAFRCHGSLLRGRRRAGTGPRVGRHDERGPGYRAVSLNRRREILRY
jgi:hypothetical protein